MRLQIPVKCCHVCSANYNLDEWAQLEQLPPNEKYPHEEHRQCRCGQALTVDVEGYKQLNTTRRVDDYAFGFPASDRPRDELHGQLRVSRTRHVRRIAIAGAVGVVVCLSGILGYLAALL